MWKGTESSKSIAEIESLYSSWLTGSWRGTRNCCGTAGKFSKTGRMQLLTDRSESEIAGKDRSDSDLTILEPSDGVFRGGLSRVRQTVDGTMVRDILTATLPFTDGSRRILEPAVVKIEMQWSRAWRQRICWVQCSDRINPDRILSTDSGDPSLGTETCNGWRLGVTDWLWGCGAEYVLTDLGVIRDWFCGAKHV
ncbi:hypothetical protein F2Q70_00036782 [Brassica cretica]|uniref:Uncharacterized protein n=1 Tax=Brassica cretica TaxID=69181 RepID=A0A8S9JYF5_BRACR|nr:hypothetical protein F2Q68_00032085 [Brassica cretica]KAF2586577.1 hypothetical protein F2Q70_00036782 [Brassica cretica]